MEQVILYTTHCPRCKVLKKKLEQKEINFVEIDSIEEMEKLGITSVPQIKLANSDELLDFTQAVNYINGLEV